MVPSTDSTSAHNTSSREKLSPNVLLLGWVSLLNDVATEMLYPIIPLFFRTLLGASAPALLGLIDGTAEGLGNALRWIGGVLSDRFRRRKPFVLVGYLLSALAKPIMGLSAFVLGWPLFLVGRCTDRFGKSVRNAARDALLAASVSKESRGRAFGFQRGMDTCGAVIGPLITLGIIIALAGFNRTFWATWKGSGATLASLPLKWLFFAALIPGLLASACVLALKELRPDPQAPTKTGGKPPPIFQAYPAQLWRILLAAFVFSLGNSSDMFLIMRSSDIGLGFGLIIVVYALYNVVYAAASEPLGRLSDKIGRKPLLMAGWAIYAVVYAGFALLHAAWAPWLLLCVYGLYQGMTDGVTGALISDTVPDHKRAGAIGLYYTAVGLGQFAASAVAGMVYGMTIFHGHVMLTFALGSICALAAIPLLATAPVRREH